MKKAPHEEYLDTVQRLEPDISPVDRDGALTSIAISLKRIADALQPAELGGLNMTVSDILHGIMLNGQNQ